MKAFSREYLKKMIDVRNKKISDLTKRLRAEEMLSNALSKLDLHAKQDEFRIGAVKKAMLAKQRAAGINA